MIFDDNFDKQNKITVNFWLSASSRKIKTSTASMVGVIYIQITCSFFPALHFTRSAASILQWWFIPLAKVLSITNSGTSALVAPMMPLAFPFQWLGEGREAEGWRNNGASDRLLFWWPHVCCRLWYVAWIKKNRGQAEHANRVIVAGFQMRAGSPRVPLVSHHTHVSPSNKQPSPSALPRACRVILTSWFPNRTTKTPLQLPLLNNLTPIWRKKAFVLTSPQVQTKHVCEHSTAFTH